MKDAPDLERCDDPERVALRSPAGSTASWLLASLGFFVALAVVHTWPLASAPGVLSRNDNGDTVLHEWILAWVAHQLVSDPLRLFDANIFYPERHTLAYSDHLFVQSLMGAPLTVGGLLAGARSQRRADRRVCADRLDDGARGGPLDRQPGWPGC